LKFWLTPVLDVFIAYHPVLLLWDDSYKRNVGAMIPQGTDQTPEDMAAAVLFFIDNPHVTGQTINVDGGCCC
ncbi:MAG TPA: hypothetical protein VHQ70_11110, partial [Syntrophomonadaceae bacterium]|nr:hypothetical protein [Syntrophomonadaceae bacterium]